MGNPSIPSGVSSAELIGDSKPESKHHVDVFSVQDERICTRLH